VSVFFLLALSHVLGDVVFTSYRLAVLKRSSALLGQLLGVGCHGLVHAALAGILLRAGGFCWLHGAIMVFVFHFMIDLVRSSVEKRRFGHGRIYVRRSEFVAWIRGKSSDRAKMNLRNLGPWFVINILDQSAHLGSLVLIASLL
jgi:FtsH-binding integral membrane protein